VYDNIGNNNVHMILNCQLTLINIWHVNLEKSCCCQPTSFSVSFSRWYGKWCFQVHYSLQHFPIALHPSLEATIANKYTEGASHFLFVHLCLISLLLLLEFQLHPFRMWGKCKERKWERRTQRKAYLFHHTLAALRWTALINLVIA